MLRKRARKKASKPFRGIGRLSERSLHAAIKKWYAVSTDRDEVSVGGYVIDLVRGDTLIEIQTGSFSAIRPKLSRLIGNHKVRLVHPIAKRKWIVRVSKRDGRVMERRKVSREGGVLDIFDELVSIPHLIGHANFTLDVLLTEEEEVWCADGKGSWRRRGMSIVDRRLVSVVNRVELHTLDDFRRFLPAGLPDEFTSRDLGRALKVRIHSARRITYCLRRMGVIRKSIQRGRTFVFRRADP